jgi:hypothetical protein
MWPAGHPSYTRFIFLWAKKNKEGGGKEKEGGGKKKEGGGKNKDERTRKKKGA